jgi:hypothetical protein
MAATSFSSVTFQSRALTAELASALFAEIIQKGVGGADGTIRR